jgi:iron complex transport system permease protein
LTALVLRKQDIFFILLLLFLLVTLGIINLLYAGSESVSFSNFHSQYFIFWEIRLPKAIAAILAGSSLAVSGLILQILFRNPLAGPYVLGISSGASLMVAITLLTSGSIGFQLNSLLGSSSLVLAAITGSVVLTIIVAGLATRIKNNTILLLMGLMIGQLAGAAQGFLEYFSSNEQLKRFVLWGMGSLRQITTLDLLVYTPVVLGALLVCIFLSKSLQLLTLGEHYAQNLGLNVKQHRLFWIITSGILTGVTTAFCGPIAFVGISVPIASRLLFKTSSQLFHSLSCLLMGACVLLLSDTLCFIYEGSLPINLITTLIGCPFVIYLLLKQKTW